MQDCKLYAQILGIRTPWQVERLELKLAEGEVRIHLVQVLDSSGLVRHAGVACPLSDHQVERRWRHLDACQFKTILHARAAAQQLPDAWSGER